MNTPTYVRQFAKLLFGGMLATALSASAFASCGDSLLALGSGKAIVSSAAAALAGESTGGFAQPNSIVGMWYTQFVVNGQTIQEAYQIWNSGGTEVHNPNVDPRTSSICLGTWVKLPSGAYKLAHRVWMYDTEGNFLALVKLSETVRVIQKGAAHHGTFILDIYDPTGKFVNQVKGDVVAQRVQVE